MITIVTSAIRAADGRVFFDPERKPRRHNYVVGLMVHAGLPRPVTKDATQGFLTSDGLFVDRIYAAEIAEAAGQVAWIAGFPLQLYSEDLWPGNLEDP